MNLGTWNVRSLYKPVAVKALIPQFQQYKVYIAGMGRLDGMGKQSQIWKIALGRARNQSGGTLCTNQSPTTNNSWQEKSYIYIFKKKHQQQPLEKVGRWSERGSPHITWHMGLKN
jgi:hypothetical protein